MAEEFPRKPAQDEETKNSGQIRIKQREDQDSQEFAAAGNLVSRNQDQNHEHYSEVDPEEGKHPVPFDRTHMSCILFHARPLLHTRGFESADPEDISNLLGVLNRRFPFPTTTG